MTNGWRMISTTRLAVAPASVAVAIRVRDSAGAELAFRFCGRPFAIVAPLGPSSREEKNESISRLPFALNRRDVEYQKTGGATLLPSATAVGNCGTHKIGRMKFTKNL